MIVNIVDAIAVIVLRHRISLEELWPGLCSSALVPNNKSGMIFWGAHRSEEFVGVTSFRPRSVVIFWGPLRSAELVGASFFGP